MVIITSPNSTMSPDECTCHPLGDAADRLPAVLPGYSRPVKLKLQLPRGAGTHRDPSNGTQGYTPRPPPAKENGGVREDSAIPARALLPADSRSSARQLHRSVHPLDPVARVATSLRASLYRILASTRYRLTMNLATNQRAQGRDRTNVCMCHLDHLLQLPWAHRRRVPPTEAARPKLIF
jgi:hypothetical protein